MIRMTTDPIDPDALRRELFDPAAGAYCAFEGWVRNENEGHTVRRLEYEGYDPVAITEGEKILAEAREKFAHVQAHCVHRTGMMDIGDCAVWVGVASPHLTAFGDGVLFQGATANTGTEPWVSDGTAAGTRMLKDNSMALRHFIGQPTVTLPNSANG